MAGEGRRYRMMALIVASVDVQADSAEEADALLSHVSPADYELLEWIDTSLTIETKPGSDEFVTVSDWTQPDLWADLASERKGGGDGG